MLTFYTVVKAQKRANYPRSCIDGTRKNLQNKLLVKHSQVHFVCPTDYIINCTWKRNPLLLLQKNCSNCKQENKISYVKCYIYPSLYFVIYSQTELSSFNFSVVKTRPWVFCSRNWTDGKEFPKQIISLAFFSRVRSVLLIT